MAENIPSTVAETPVVYKRFSQADKISQGTNNTALSLNDYIPGQHVTGPNQNDIAATLAQLQAIPIGTATLSGNTYNVTISNYPNSATIYPGQKISVQFQNDAPTAEDTALNLSAFGKSLPMCARGIRMSRGSIKAGMVLNFIYWPDKWNADYDLVENVNGVLKYAESSSVYNKQSVDTALTTFDNNFTFYESGFQSKDGFYKIEIPFVMNSNTTTQVDILINTRGAQSWLLSCYNFYREDNLSESLISFKLRNFGGCAYPDIFGQVIRGTYKVTERKLEIYIQHKIYNSRVVFCVLGGYRLGTLRDNIIITSSTKIDDWYNAEIESDIIFLAESSVNRWSNKNSLSNFSLTD